MYAYMLGQHLESEANDSLPESRLDSLPAGLGEVYAVNFERAFPEGQEDSAWTEAKRLVELIAAAREPITVAMAAALLRCDCGQQERVLETTALLFPFRCASDGNDQSLGCRFVPHARNASRPSVKRRRVWCVMVQQFA